MAEDMTYEPVQTVAQLAARVQELERELAQAHSNTVALAERNAELRAQLVLRDDLADAVRAIYNDVPVSNWTRKPLRVIRDWLKSVGKQVSL